MTKALAMSDGVVTLPRALTVAEAAPLANLLKESTGSPLSINANEVEHVGAQCLQVLLAAASSWRADGHSLTYIDPSSTFIDGIQRLGVSQDALAV
ncbi:MAG: STAS domain-containing protein [Pseudomonadota bacterium]